MSLLKTGILAIAAVVLSSRCGGLPTPTWEPEVVCSEAVGDFRFQRAPSGGCEMAGWYADQLPRVMRAASDGGALPVPKSGRWQFWVWDADGIEARDGALGSWEVGTADVWLERCMLGLAHETLHQWDVMQLDRSAFATGQHWSWGDESTGFKAVDVTWQWNARLWCPRWVADAGSY